MTTYNYRNAELVSAPHRTSERPAGYLAGEMPICIGMTTYNYRHAELV